MRATGPVVGETRPEPPPIGGHHPSSASKENDSAVRSPDSTKASMRARDSNCEGEKSGGSNGATGLPRNSSSCSSVRRQTWSTKTKTSAATPRRRSSFIGAWSRRVHRRPARGRISSPTHRFDHDSRRVHGRAAIRDTRGPSAVRSSPPKRRAPPQDRPPSGSTTRRPIVTRRAPISTTYSRRSSGASGSSARSTAIATSRRTPSLATSTPFSSSVPSPG